MPRLLESVCMKFNRIPAVLLLTLFFQGATVAATDQQFAAIKRLGELNGVALHCHYLEQTQRMKRVLVMTLPKRRQLGELFDIETNTSFMSFMAAQATCPREPTFKEQVDAAVQQLETVFSKP